MFAAGMGTEKFGVIGVADTVIGANDTAAGFDKEVFGTN